MDLSANHWIRGRTGASNSTETRITALLVGLTFLLLPLALRAETPLRAWERIEEVRQSQGATRAIPLAREALQEQPEFPPLWSQYARLRTSVGGFTGARALRDSLRAHGAITQARWAESFLAREEGRFQAGLDTLNLVSPPPAGSVEELFRRLSLAVLEVGARREQSADSLLTLIEGETAILPSPGIAQTLVGFTVEELRAVVQLQSGEIDEALARLEDLAQRGASENFFDLSMRVQHIRARTLASLTRYEPSLLVYDQELDLARRLGDRWQLAAATAWKAFALERLNRYAPALELRKLCLAEFPQLGDTLGTSYSMLSLGWDAMQVGKSKTAEAVFAEALREGRRHQWKWMESQACNNLGVLYMNAGRFDLSMATLERALALASTENDTYRKRSALNNIAILHMERGRPDQALEIYEKLLALHRLSQDVPGELAILNNMALASEQMGQDAQARVMYEQSVAIAEGHGLANNGARINLGWNASVNGQWDEGERVLRAAVADARGRRDADQLAAAHGRLGACLAFQGKEEEALAHLLTADRLRRDAGIVMGRVPDLLQLARVEISLQRGSDALAALDRARPLIHNYERGFEASFHAIRARAFLEAGAADSAWTQSRRAVATAAVSWAGEDAGDRLGKQIAAGHAIEVMLQIARDRDDGESDGLVRETFDLLQQVQSHSLLEYVQGSQRSIEPEVSDSLLEAERAARVAVDQLQRNLSSGLHSVAFRDSLRLALAEAQARQERLRTRIFRLDRRYRDLTQPASLDSTGFEQLLGSKTLVLDYLSGHGCELERTCPILLFAADSLGVDAYTLGETEEIKRQVNLLADLLAHPPAPDDRGNVQLLLRELGRVLLGPVAKRIERYDSVIVVPDGVLSRVPFAALRIPIAGDPSREAYLVEKVTIQTVPSLAVLSQLRRSERRAAAVKPRWDIVIWYGAGTVRAPDGSPADPTHRLPHAEDELHALRAGFTRTTVFRVNPRDFGENGRELSNLVPSGSSKVLHFIAHGYFDRRQPWRSGLYFAGDPTGQGSQKLEIVDIYRMKPHCSLVILSACETARGSSDEGVGFLGLTQALFGSGVPSVLATLWPIDDASAPTFISTFYRQLADGSSKAEALRQTQLQFLRDETLRQPFYWAPYVLLGDGSGGVELTARRSIPLATPMVTLAIGLILLLAALGSWRRKSHS